MLIKIDNIEYQVADISEGNEFEKIFHKDYNNLILYKDLPELERMLGFIKQLKIDLELEDIYFFYISHGGFLPLNASKFFKNVYIVDINNFLQKENLCVNIRNQKIDNIKIINEFPEKFLEKNLIVDFLGIVPKENIETNPFIISNKPNNSDYCYKLWESSFYLSINPNYKDRFIENFHFFLEEKTINFDNLINLCIMVKNAGPQFENMLINNLPLIDQWTILDTGSTDETIEIINRILVGKKKGKLYQEPFINFKDSRNRLLDLAGESCKYTLMLDDTYNIKLNLRAFLNEVRSDQFADSYTLYIKSDDTEYGSNRILKSNRKLRYINKIHEVITDKNNINVVVPINRAYILDERYDYMEKRTMDRKQLDLKLLFEELEEDPNNSRTHYYLGQTYNLLGDYENCYKWFKARVEHPNPGFIQEKVDAAFELARCANFKLNRPWEECEKLYNQAYELDKSRPESLYFLGIHYFLVNNFENAYKYFKEAFKIGYPIHCQYSLKPTLSFHFCPKFLTKVCYLNNDFLLGEEAALFFLNHNKPSDDAYDEIVSWLNIYKNLNIYKAKKSFNKLNKPIFCLIVDGGFKPWNGSSINNEGVGGSETWAIETARYINKSNKYKVFVFCKCSKEENFEGVEYLSLEKVFGFLNQYDIEHCIISRFSEYIPLAYKSNCKNVYLILHDLGPSGIVIPIENKLKKVFCLTEWHCKYFLERFPSLNDRTEPLYYGIDHYKFSGLINEKERKKYNFIYSSTANRGLLPLLQMWPKLYNKQPKISLDIYCDLENNWVNSVAKEQVNEIKRLIIEYSFMGIRYHGWVNKYSLAKGWKKADIWFYPCIFQETFCLTALEAALSKTFVITNGLAALENTVGDRGICIPGNPIEIEWQEKAIEIVAKYLEDIPEKIELIEKNYSWAKNLSWEGQTDKLLNKCRINEVINNNLDNGGMENWLNDLPTGSKQIFDLVIDYFNRKRLGNTCKILEIGVYAGLSLIELVKRIPNSEGLGIDEWKNYDEFIKIDNQIIKNNLVEYIEEREIERLFNDNVVKSGLKDRIKSRKGKSTDILISLIKENSNFDFIYVDGSHLCLDTYSDLILAWQILNKGGILVIDDYLLNKDNILNSPYEAVNFFLKKYLNEYNLLSSGYRVFIEKL